MLLPDVAETQEFYISFPLLVVHHHNVQLFSQHHSASGVLACSFSTLTTNLIENYVAIEFFFWLWYYTTFLHPAGMWWIMSGVNLDTQRVCGQKLEGFYEGPRLEIQYPIKVSLGECSSKVPTRACCQSYLLVLHTFTDTHTHTNSCWCSSSVTWESGWL